MAVVRHCRCRITYLDDEILISGPSAECRREADRILRQFACSDTPYRLVRTDSGNLLLRPA